MNWKRNLPIGMRDKLFREAYGMYHLEKHVNQLLEQQGYQRIETPLVEFEDVFTVEKDYQRGVYRFDDVRGRTQVLRPDVTLPVGRVVATTGVTLPLKLYYSGKIFRSNEELSGEKNELTQIGIELVGYHSLKAEIQCLLTSYEVMKIIDFPHFHFELGHAQIMTVIKQCLALDVADERLLRQHLVEKNISAMKQFVQDHPSELDSFMLQLPLLFGPLSEVVAQGLDLLPEHHQLRETINEILTLAQIVRSVEADISLTVDLGLLPAMNYYSGIIFNGYGDEIAENFLSGGRYDQLVEAFNHEAVPAVGMALNVDVLVQGQYRLGTLAKLPVIEQLIYAPIQYWQQAQQLVTETRQLSLFDSVEETLDYARRWGIPEVYVLGETTDVINVEEG